MEETKQNLVYTDGLKALQNRMQLMYNNKDHSDTVFIINEQKFFVSKQLISVASKKLDEIMIEYFTYCDDTEIKLHEVKCEQSFAIILKYMYGLDMNFDDMKIEVLCSVIQLSEKYQLDQFSKDLQTYLSKIDQFDINSLTVLLNTARKYNLNELYEKLKVFAFENAEKFVKHESIVHLLYEVLLDLIKSDWFFAPEIDILRGVLNWHIEMNTTRKKCIEENQDVMRDTAGLVFSDNSMESKEHIIVETNIAKENQDITQYTMESKEAFQTNMAEENQDALKEGNEDNLNNTASKELFEINNTTASKEPLEINIAKRNLDTEQNEVKIENEDNSNQLNTNTEVEISKKKLKCSELKKSFSENVLKSLFPHIRGKQILWFDIVALNETNLYEKYKHVLDDTKLFSQTDVLRRKYVSVACNQTRNIGEIMSTGNPVQNIFGPPPFLAQTPSPGMFTNLTSVQAQTPSFGMSPSSQAQAASPGLSFGMSNTSQAQTPSSVLSFGISPSSQAQAASHWLSFGMSDTSQAQTRSPVLSLGMSPASQGQTKTTIFMKPSPLNASPSQTQTQSSAGLSSGMLSVPPTSTPSSLNSPISQSPKFDFRRLQ